MKHKHIYRQSDQDVKLFYTIKGYWCICGKEKIRYTPSLATVFISICVIAYIVGMCLFLYKVIGE